VVGVADPVDATLGRRNVAVRDPKGASVRSPLPILTRTTGATPTRRMSWAEDLVTLVLAACLVGGLFLDGWAHNTRPQLETFFTPWHAVFYSGFAAVAIWIGWSVWSRRAVPAGYGPALAGVVIFLVSGAGDMSWHLAFGIERDIAPPTWAWSPARS
jgi:hypothetical protein